MIKGTMRVILLGTGGPRPDAQRCGPAVLVQAGGDNLLFDAGRGVAVQLARVGVTTQSLAALLVTHHHFDHIGDLADVLLSGWNQGGRPLRIFGPPGTRRLVAALLGQVYGCDIATRLAESDRCGQGLRDPRQRLRARDVDAGAVWRTQHWRIRAERMAHMTGLGLSARRWTCLGYRVACGGKVVAISGDTVDAPGLRRLARGADLLVQCCYLSEAESRDPACALVSERILTSSHQLGRIAAESGVRRLVLTHIREKPPSRLRAMRDEARRGFDGEVIVGRDLQSFEV